MSESYQEYYDSQLPAINLLKKMGWQYLTPVEAFKLRGEMYSNVILEEILQEKLNDNNDFEYRGDSYKFSSGSIQGAINSLKNIPFEGLVQTNEKVYDLITLGKSFSETIQGDKKAYTINYMDWKQPEKNVYHFTDEMIIESATGRKIPDLVLFVNGIPFVVIENKRRDKGESVEEAISQQIRNQRDDVGVPKLFYYTQLLLAVQPNEVKYGVTGTPAKFWAIWKEDVDKPIQKLLKSKTNHSESEERQITQQDRAIFSLCEPIRLMDLVYKYIVFDGPVKKICRYQQYFAVQETINRVKQYNHDGVRRGGVIWHTTGSGKSLTMVMLSKALALESSIENSRVVIVTDRINLDKQIHKTFVNCGKRAEKARSGNHLLDLLEDKGNEIITTVLDKFGIATSKSNFKEDSKNIFVLVDESHRSQYGSAHAYMRKILPNASYIGFTGTPLLKTEINTSKKFGGFIHKYSIDQAVKDGAVLPLLYEGRSAILSVNKAQIDKGFDRLSENLSEEATKDLKRKFSSINKIFESEHVVEEIGFDIAKHFVNNWQGTGYKAQLAVPRIDTAVKYQKYFETQLQYKINTNVIFTPPDSKQDVDDVWSNTSDESKQYWNQIISKYRDQETYENLVIEKFKDPSDEVEIIIVVNKLLTGFDAPRNTVLYLAKPLMGHNLLQAISRVNRLFEGKEYGYIIDYVGILGKLDEALTEYSALEDFFESDIENAVFDIGIILKKIPIVHQNVLDIFKEVYNKKDIETLERHLQLKDLRDEFYSRVNDFARILQTAFASKEFYEDYTNEQIDFYKSELKKFISLRTSVQYRYAEKVSFKEYEPRVRKLLDTYIDVNDIEIITPELNIFDNNKVEEALSTYGKSDASKADFIAHKMKKVINENLEKDEIFFKKFSELIEQTIRAFHEGRIDEKEYLEQVIKLNGDLQEGNLEGIPELIKNNEKSRPFFNILKEVLGIGNKQMEHNIAIISLSMTEIIENLIITDWKKNLDIAKKMENEIEDYLLYANKEFNLNITFEQIDNILLKCLKTAKNNY
jgi:type I restriction enzyme R subunit